LKLSKLIEGLAIKSAVGMRDVEIGHITVDSREARGGSLFVAIAGHKLDGHDFIAQAVKNGASAVVADREIGAGVPVIAVADTSLAEAILARRLFGEPDLALLLAGVTGTNGKTSTAFLLRSVLDMAAGPAGVIGTVGYGTAGRMRSSERTTPGASGLYSILGGFVADGCRSAVMEVSSHAAAQGRIEGLEFDVGVFTNITRDHLDYHGTLENYIEAKEIFVRSLDRRGRTKKNGTIVYNNDDLRVRSIGERFGGDRVSFGMGDDAMVRAEDARAFLEGTSFTLATPVGRIGVDLKLLGRFSIFNALAAAGAALAASIGLEEIKAGLEGVEGVPGRFQVIRREGGPVVVVDYAHTPDALENLLRFCRELEPGRLITVFGCGGDRDRGKRPMMGKVSVEYSDRVIVTSDNPRSEDPRSIINEVLSGTAGSKTPVDAIVDRASAIRAAVGEAREGDIVAVAGKGHEDYQEAGGAKIHFSDMEEAGKALQDAEVGYQD